MKAKRCRWCRKKKRKLAGELFCSIWCLKDYEKSLEPPITYSLDSGKEFAAWRQLGRAHWSWLTGPMVYNLGYMKRKFLNQ